MRVSVCERVCVSERVPLSLSVCVPLSHSCHTIQATSAQAHALHACAAATCLQTEFDDDSDAEMETAFSYGNSQQPVSQ